MKLLGYLIRHSQPKSHPSRGAWIEIRLDCHALALVATSHPSRGAWIEIIWNVPYLLIRNRRTPRGVRGLK